MAKKAEKKEEKAVKGKAPKHVSLGSPEEEKAESHSRKAEKKRVSEEEKHGKKAGHKEEKREKEHAGTPKEKKRHREGEYAKKEHAHNAKEETALDASGKKEEHKGRAVSGEKEEHKGREKKRKPKKGKHHRMDFVELKPDEITEAIVHLANEGHSASEIGMILRDQYGVPMVGKALGKKLCTVLRENSLLPRVPDDMMSLIRKSVTLGEHLARNRKDMSAKRGLMLTVSKIRALEKYYKKKGILPMEWRYSPETAALLAK